MEQDTTVLPPVSQVALAALDELLESNREVTIPTALQSTRRRMRSCIATDQICPDRFYTLPVSRVIPVLNSLPEPELPESLRRKET